MFARMFDAIRALLGMALLAAALVAVVFVSGESADDARHRSSEPRLEYEPVFEVEILDDGQSYACLRRNYRLFSARLGDTQPARRIILDGRPSCMAPAPDCDRLFTGCLDGTLYFCRPKTDGQMEPVGRLPGVITSTAYSSDGRLMCAADDLGNVGIWNTQTSEQIARREGNRQQVDVAEFCCDGRTVVIREWNGSITHWDPQTQAVLKTYRCGEVGNGDLSCSATAPLAAWGGRVGQSASLHVWNVKSGQRLWKNDFPPIRFLPANLLRLTFSPDGRVVACGYRELLALFDAATGQVLAEAFAKDHQLTTLTFTPDSRTLVSGGSDGSIRGWDGATLSSKWTRWTDAAGARR